MLIVDLATLVMEVRDLYPTALQVHSPALRMMLTTPLPSNVATELKCKTIISVLNHFKTTGALIF
jgi:hypothetical protein